jgi:endonuclease YncB( thermonuclease family)
MKLSVVLILFLVIIFGTMVSALWINFEDHTVFARCPNGYHKSPSGDCEKVTDTKDLPRCPNGYHRSPDGDCEKVSESDSSSSSENNDKSSAESNSDSTSSEDIIPSNKPNPTLPAPTLSEGIEISGPIKYVVDGDTLDVNNIRIRLSLVNTPEVGEQGFDTAKNFVEKLCLDKNGEVDIDDGQRQGSFGREIGVVYCDGVNLNSELMSKGYAVISTEFCDVSEFSGEPWVKSSCQIGTRDENENNSLTRSDQDSSSLSQKQEQQVPFGSESSESNEAQSYSNSKLGISLKHPTDWKVANLKNGIQLIKEKNGVYVEIRKHNLESPDVQLKQYVGDDIKDRSSSREDFKLLNITKTTISGNLPAYKALYTFLKTENEKDFTIEGTTNKILRIWTFAEKNSYHVAFVADKDKYDLYLPIAEKIIDTLKINPGSQQSFSDNDSNDKKKSSNQENENSNHKGSSSNEDSDGGSGRCKDGYHKDESGECEKVVDNKGKPRCPNGYHRSPDGDCEPARD